MTVNKWNFNISLVFSVESFKSISRLFILTSVAHTWLSWSAKIRTDDVANRFLMGFVSTASIDLFIEEETALAGQLCGKADRFSSSIAGVPLFFLFWLEIYRLSLCGVCWKCFLVYWHSHNQRIRVNSGLYIPSRGVALNIFCKSGSNASKLFDNNCSLDISSIEFHYSAYTDYTVQFPSGQHDDMDVRFTWNS